MRGLTVFFVICSLFTLALGCSPKSLPGAYTDDVGRQVNIEKTPQRLVSHVPSVTEILFALGLEAEVVGVSDFCDYPPEAKLKPKVGNYFNPSIEKIVALNPDLVLTDGHSQNILQLDSVGIPYLVLQPKDIDGIFKDIELVGKVTGTDKSAAKLIASMQEQLTSVSARVKDAPRSRVFYVFDATDLNNPWTAGPGSFVDSLITLAGGKNIAGNAAGAWVQFSLEQVVSSDPEIIIIDASHGTPVVPREVLKEHPAWRQTTAVRQGQVFTIDGDLTSRPGPRIMLGLEEMAKIIHPELFK